MTMKRTAAAIFAALIIGGGCVSPSVPVDDQPETEAPQQQDEDEQADEAEAVEEDIGEPYVAEAVDTAELIRSAVEGEHRDENNIARNEYRNPVETLEFFGLDPDMDVVEIWPGGGWYTEVLAPVLAEGEGTLTAAIFEIDEDDPEGYLTRITTQYLEKLEENPEVYGEVQTATFSPPESVELEQESADMVLTFRNLHNVHARGGLDGLIETFYQTLEPGGTMGVVQHRAPEGSDPDETAEDGYLPEQFVIEQFEEAGFEFVESSEINANPEDTADHPEGVWSLPPTLRGGEEDAGQFEAIGESDRMTLRFVRPEAEEVEEKDEEETEGEEES